MNFRTTLKTLFLLALCVGLAPIPAQAQIHSITSTTNSAAIGLMDNTITVGAATGITTNTILYVEREAMRVSSTYDGTSLTVPVNRGTDGTARRAHLVSQTVYIGRPNWFQVVDISGSCTLASLEVHPWINIRTGQTFECLTSNWTITNGPATKGVGLTAVGPLTAGNVPIGSALLPFQKLYFGTAATNNIILTPGATAAARTVTMDDPLGNDKLAYLAAAQTFTSKTLTSAIVDTDIRAKTAGSDTLGTAAKPFGTLYLGTAATNNMVITPAATAAARAISMADPGGAASLSYIQAYDCGNANACSSTAKPTMHVITGVTAALDGASPSVAAVTGMSPAFTSNATYHCTATGTGNTAAIAAGGVAATYVSGSAVTFTSANGLTNTVHYVCVGW